MKRTIRAPHRAQPRRRRGVTLVEMLVTVAMLVIIMTILVQIFQAATGALSAAQAIQQLDDQLRRLDATDPLRPRGASRPASPRRSTRPRTWAISSTARTSSPTSRGKTATTTSASPPRPRRAGRSPGRMWVTPSARHSTHATTRNVQPVTITSDYAEIIYFLRNGNLYRRVLLVAPNSSRRLHQVHEQSVDGSYAFYPTLSATAPPRWPVAAVGDVPVSWQGVNDLSARPAAPRATAAPRREPADRPEHAWAT